MAIEKYLILNKYLLSLFGVQEFKELKDKFKDVEMELDSDGRTNFINILRSSFNLKDNLKEDELLRYDLNIQGYVKSIESEINKKSKEKIRLESFILSPTPYKELEKGEIKFTSKEEFLKYHVLFMKDDKNWPEYLCSELLFGKEA